MTKPRIAFIGCGNIAEFHAPAFRAAGFDLAAVCSRPESPSLRPFAQRHNIPLVFDEVSKLLEARKEWDALLISVSIDGTLEVLNAALEAGAPVLVEKPVAWRSEELAPFLSLRLPVIVGYNRRFYRTVRKARDEVLNGPPLLARLELPEAIVAPTQSSDDLSYLRPFFGNSVHGFDLVRYVFGELELVEVQRVTGPEGSIRGLSAVLTSARGDVLHFTGNWQAPANFSLTLDRPGRRFEVRPFEAATVYEGMEVTPPTAENPVRTYKPKQVETVGLEEVDYRYKPGFLNQALALAALVRGDDPGDAARLEDAYAALVLAENLAGQSLPAVRSPLHGLVPGPMAPNSELVDVQENQKMMSAGKQRRIYRTL